MLETIQVAIYKARWVDAQGKNSGMASDKEIAETVLAAIQERYGVEE